MKTEGHSGDESTSRGPGDGLAVGGSEAEETGMVAWFLSRVTEWKVVSLDSLRNTGGAPGMEGGQ